MVDEASPGGTSGEPSDTIAEESREEMLTRQRKEIKELQAMETAMKKAAAKGSKAEQKAKKKAADEEIASLDAKMKARHTKELASLGFRNTQDLPSTSTTSDMDILVKALAGVHTGREAGGNEGRVSKAQKRRDKKMQQDASREQRIQEEQGNIVSERVIEDAQLAQKLQPLSLSLKEIKPDGHCLYRAVEDQLRLQGGFGSAELDYLALRGLAANYMRSHADDFLPFVVAEDGIEIAGGQEEVRGQDQAMARFEQYCQDVESTATWGGQLELGALAQALQKRITVYSADLPVVEMGREDSDADSQKEPLRLSYHRHAFGLGEHYNSVVPLAVHCENA